MTYTVGSLFSGIGGFDWPFSLVGFDVRWQVEIDPFCQQVLKKHAPQYWPNARMYGDVRELGKHNLEPVDAVVGGPPCQAASTAGKRLGKQDDRWLWGEALRIVKEIQPRFVLFENVPGLRSLDGGNSFREILGGLAEAGLNVEWFHLRASDVGAPHRRERIFIVAYRQHEGRIGGRTHFGDGHADYWPEGIAPQDNSGWSELVGGTGAGSDDVAHADVSGRGQEQPWDQNGTTGSGAVGVVQDDAYGKSPRYGHNGTLGLFPNSLGGDEGSGDSLQDENHGHVEPGLVRILNELPTRMDRVRRQSRWPSRPGEAQYEWEAPRTAKGVKNRVARLKSLGNAVVPACILPIAEAIWTALAAEDNAAAEEAP